VELTSIKLIVSSVVGLILACVMEGGDETRDSWWVAFIELSKSTRWGVIGGALLISVFQVNCTFLTFLTSAVGLGLVGQVKIIPQWFLAAFSARGSPNFQFHWMNLLGAALIMVSAAGFAIFNWIVSSSTCIPYHDVEKGGYATGDEDCSTATHDVENSETKPLILMSDADDWGAAYMQKNYCAVDKEGGNDNACINGTTEPIIPLLNTTASSQKPTTRHPHHHEHSR
jgi:hypothetical protein